VGSELVHGIKPVQAADLARTYESVTLQKLQDVSGIELRTLYTETLLTAIHRLPRPCSRARPPSRRLVTSTPCPSRRSWVSGYRIETRGEFRQCSIKLESSRGGRNRKVHFVNISSNFLLTSTIPVPLSFVL